MSKILIIGDIHNNTPKVDKILDEWGDKDPVVFVGDYWDSFDENYKNLDGYYSMRTDKAERTAKWVKHQLTIPSRILLIGNHCLGYMSPFPCFCSCSGFSTKKWEAINSVMSEDDWSKMKFFHQIEHYWISHAGITPYHFECPVRGLTVETIEEKLRRARFAFNAGNRNSDLECIVAADRWRGGNCIRGGIVWCDWRSLDEIDGVIQIVGHTPQTKIIEKPGRINVDCGLLECLILNTSTLTHEIWDTSGI
jgi:hypothetical protein